MTETATTAGTETETETRARVEFFGLNGFAVVVGHQVVTASHRTREAAEVALAAWNAR